MLFCSTITPLIMTWLTVHRMGCRNVAGSVVHVGNGSSRTPWWRWDLHTQEKIDDDSEFWGFLSQVAAGTTSFIWHADRGMVSREALEPRKCETSPQWYSWGGGIQHQSSQRITEGDPHLEPTRVSVPLGWLRWSSQLLSPTTSSPTQPTNNWEAWLPGHSMHVCS